MWLALKNVEMKRLLEEQLKKRVAENLSAKRKPAKWLQMSVSLAEAEHTREDENYRWEELANAIIIQAVQDWREAGMNLCLSPHFVPGEDDPSDMAALLDECAANGIRLILDDPRCHWSGVLSDPDGYKARFRRNHCTKHGGNHRRKKPFPLGTLTIRSKRRRFSSAFEWAKSMRSASASSLPISSAISW